MKLYFLILLAIISSTQALTFNESIGIRYKIDDKRWEDILKRVEEAQFAGLKTTLIKTLAINYCITWEQSSKLLQSYKSEEERMTGFEILANITIDRYYIRSNITTHFSTNATLEKAEALIAKGRSCLFKASAADPFPVSTIKNKVAWIEEDFSSLVHEIKKLNTSNSQIAYLNETLKNKTEKGLAFQQVDKLLELFHHANDRTNLILATKDRLLGLTCETVNKIQFKLLHDWNRVLALGALKSSIIDYENRYLLLDAFQYDNTKEAARMEFGEIDESLYVAPASQKQGLGWRILIPILIVLSIIAVSVCYKIAEKEVENPSGYVSLGAPKKVGYRTENIL